MKLITRIVALVLIVTFGTLSVAPSELAAQVQPSAVSVQSSANPSILTPDSLSLTPVFSGIKIYPQEPFRFDFIMNEVTSNEKRETGTDDRYALPVTRYAQVSNQELLKLVKYFMAALTVPEGDLWVNLSPYEPDRIVPHAFGQTEMGRDLLSQDYILKQLTASLMNPEGESGKRFWEKVYEKVYESQSFKVSESQSFKVSESQSFKVSESQSFKVSESQSFKVSESQAQLSSSNATHLSSSNASIEDDSLDQVIQSFNKVWIVPDKVEVYQNGDVAYIVSAKLKVMMESDYIAQQESQKLSSSNASIEDPVSFEDKSKENGFPTETFGNDSLEGRQDDGGVKDIIRSIIIPLIEDEVNNGEAFANLRQIFHSMILAKWYEQHFKNSILGQSYVDKNVTEGIGYEKVTSNEERETSTEDVRYALPVTRYQTINDIYNQYVAAFKSSANQIIKEDYDPVTQTIVPRRYFSGGFSGNINDMAMMSKMPISGLPEHMQSVSVSFERMDPAMMSSAKTFLLLLALSFTFLSQNAFTQNLSLGNGQPPVMFRLNIPLNAPRHINKKDRTFPWAETAAYAAVSSLTYWYYHDKTEKISPQYAQYNFIDSQTDGRQTPFFLQTEKFPGSFLRRQLISEMLNGAFTGFMGSWLGRDNWKTSLKRAIQGSAFGGLSFASKYEFVRTYEDLTINPFPLLHDVAWSGLGNLSRARDPFYQLRFDIGPAEINIYLNGQYQDRSDKFDAKISVLNSAFLLKNLVWDLRSQDNYFLWKESLRQLAPVFYIGQKSMLEEGLYGATQGNVMWVYKGYESADLATRHVTLPHEGLHRMQFDERLRFSGSSLLFGSNRFTQETGIVYEGKNPLFRAILNSIEYESTAGLLEARLAAKVSDLLQNRRYNPSWMESPVYEFEYHFASKKYYALNSRQRLAGALNPLSFPSGVKTRQLISGTDVVWLYKSPLRLTESMEPGVLHDLLYLWREGRKDKHVSEKKDKEKDFDPAMMAAGLESPMVTTVSKRILPKEKPLLLVMDVHGTLLQTTWKEEYARAYSNLTGAALKDGMEWVETRVVGDTVSSTRDLAPDEIMNRMLSDINENINQKKTYTDVESSVKEARDYYRNSYRHKANLGVAQFMEGSSQDKILISGSSTKVITRQLNEAGIGRYVADRQIMGGETGTREEILRKIVKQFPDKRIVYFDDGGELDKKVAEDLDIISFGIPLGIGREKRLNKDRLIRSGTDYFVDGENGWLFAAEVINDIETKRLQKNQELSMSDYLSSGDKSSSSRLRAYYLRQIRLLKELKEKFERRELAQTVTFGDKHGRTEHLSQILEMARKHAANGLKTHDLEIISHGDFFDRGIHNVEVYQMIKELRKISNDPANRVNFVHILGNHDIWFIETILLGNKVSEKIWMGHKNFGSQVIPEFLAAGINPKEVALFMLKNCQIAYEDNWGWLHVHAGIPSDSKGVPLISAEQILNFNYEWMRIHQQIIAEEYDFFKSQENKWMLQKFFDETKSLYWAMPNDWLVHFIKGHHEDFISINLKTKDKVFDYLRGALKTVNLTWDQSRITQHIQDHWVQYLIKYQDKFHGMGFKYSVKRQQPLARKSRMDRFLSELGYAGIMGAHIHRLSLLNLDSRIMIIDVDDEDPGHLQFDDQGYTFFPYDRLAEPILNREEFLSHIDGQITRIEKTIAKLETDLVGQEVAFDRRTMTDFYFPVTLHPSGGAVKLTARPSTTTEGELRIYDMVINGKNVNAVLGLSKNNQLVPLGNSFMLKHHETFSLRMSGKSDAPILIQIGDKYYKLVQGAHHFEFKETRDAEILKNFEHSQEFARIENTDPYIRFFTFDDSNGAKYLQETAQAMRMVNSGHKLQDLNMAMMHVRELEAIHQIYQSLVNKGGIDLNNLNMQTSGQVNMLNVPLDPAMMNQPIFGLVPKILHVGSVNAYQFLGLKIPDGSAQDGHADSQTSDSTLKLAFSRED